MRKTHVDCVLCGVIRAGFTLSRALFRKKCGALQLERQTLFFLKKLATFFWSSLSFHSRVAHFSGMQKFAALFVGPLFVGPLFGRTC